MVQNLLADPIHILHVNDDTGIVHNLVLLIVQLLCTLLLAVNDSIEAELHSSRNIPYIEMSPNKPILLKLDNLLVWRLEFKI